MSVTRGAIVGGVAVCAIACTHARAWRPVFDARCDCRGEPSNVEEEAATTANGVADVPNPNASLVAPALAQLAPTPASANPAATSFLTHPGDFDDAVADALASNRAHARHAADAAADGVERGVANELSSLHDALEDARAAGDLASAIEARSRLSSRYDEALAQMTDAATDAARAALPPPEKAIRIACDEVATDTLSDMTLGYATKVGIVRNHLEPYLVARYDEARDEVVATIVDAVLATHRPRLVAIVHDVP